MHSVGVDAAVALGKTGSVYAGWPCVAYREHSIPISNAIQQVTRRRAREKCCSARRSLNSATCPVARCAPNIQRALRPTQRARRQHTHKINKSRESSAKSCNTRARARSTIRAQNPYSTLRSLEPSARLTCELASRRAEGLKPESQPASQPAL